MRYLAPSMNTGIDPPPVSPTADRELVVSRVVHAPAALAFNAWTEPAQFEQWWGPPDRETVVHGMVVEPEGKTSLVMRDSNGFECPATLVYADIKAASALSYMQSDDGDPEDDAAAFGVSVRFEDVGPELTRVTMCMLFKTAAVRERAASECEAGSGAHASLGRLDRFLQAFQP